MGRKDLRRLGGWPTTNEVSVYSFQNGGERATHVAQHNDVFREIHEPNGKGPPRTGLSNWALYDTQACAAAFTIVSALFRDAIQDIVTAKDSVNYSRDEVKKRWAPDATDQTLAQVASIFEHSSLSLGRPADGAWDVTVGIHHLDRESTFDRVILNRPGKPSSDANRVIAVNDIFGASVPERPGAAYDEEGRLLRLGDWTAIRALPGGGQGEVWLVTRGKDGKSGVLKRARRDRVDPKRLERLRREARFLQELSRLGHPCIVPLLDAGAPEEEDPWLVTEFMPLGSIHDHLELFRGDVWRTLRLSRDIASALVASHAANIVHRDLKPANVLLRTVDSVAVTDFGVGFDPALQHLTTTGAEPVQSRWFSPPEALDKEAATPAWDVFMLGRLIYHALTGGQCFEGALPEGAWTLAAQLQRDDLDGVARLVNKMVQPEKAKRPEDMKTVVQDIDVVLSGRDRVGFGSRCVRCEVGQYQSVGDLTTWPPTQMGIRRPGTDVPINPFEFGLQWLVCSKCGDVQMRLRDVDRFRVYLTPK